MSHAIRIDGYGPSWLALAGLVVGGFASCDTGEARAPASLSAGPPNFVFISIDSLRADHLGCYGYQPPTSPVIDGLAAEGVRFERAISTTSWTLPSHAAMLTGLHDSAHGVTDPTRRLAGAHVTLAESLRGAGYRTAGFYGGPFLHPVFGLDQGFEVWQSCMAELGDEGDSAAEASASKGVASHGDVTGPRTLAAVEAWSAQADERPFFLFVHLWDVHYDYLAPREYVELFDTTYEGSVDGLNFDQYEEHPGLLDERDLQHLIALYDAEIRFTDDILERLLDGLRARGMLDDTILVITADHGEEFLDHGGIGHQQSLFDEVVRVPLIVHAPGRFAPGLVVEDQVSLVSLAPTLLALAGIDERPDSSGFDLRPLLEGRDLAPSRAVCELLVERPLYALRTRELKVLYEPGEHPRIGGFDLLADPGEKRRIKPKDDARIPAAVTFLDGMIEAAAEAELNAGLEPELLQRLESLGYLEGDADQEL